MEKLFKYLNKLPYDKALHALYGLIIYSLIALYNSNIAIVMVMCTAIGKELYDVYHNDIHQVDTYDAFATFAMPFILWILGGLI